MVVMDHGPTPLPGKGHINIPINYIRTKVQKRLEVMTNELHLKDGNG